MNVFEDLLTDLKEDNLLEDTVLEEHAASDEFDEEEHIRLDAEDATSGEYDLEPNNAAAHSADADSVAGNDEVPNETVTAGVASGEFFKKRAVAEVSSLQMVEHVITGVEREYMKLKPHAYDDLNAKLALNKFLKLADENLGSDDHRSAEFSLMQETEAWCTALALRDGKIFVSSLRQYCENTKPALSSQALLALCRFYRNLPCSESTRGKYDFLLTRLFTRAVADDTRVCLFNRDEAIRHLENLYKDWSSVPLYAVDDDDSKAMLTALSFDDLAQESEHASSFDQLIESDFFSRLRMFKESIAELFFAPQVAIAAVEANVRIGNSYVKLIAAERQKMDADSIQAKYSEIDHDSFSDATARTLQLVERLKASEIADQEPEPVKHRRRDTVDRSYSPSERNRKPAESNDRSQSFFKRLTQNAFAVNKWLMMFAVLLVSGSVGIYVWANYFVEESIPASGVRVVGSDNAVVHEHLTIAKVSNDILYGLLNDTWDALPKEKRLEYVQRLLAQGAVLGYTQVNLTTKDGKQAAYASKDKIDVETP
jgi:hypothetical protein